MAFPIAVCGAWLRGVAGQETLEDSLSPHLVRSLFEGMV